MKKSVLTALLSALALTLVVAASPGGAQVAAPQGKGPKFMAKGSMLVSGPVETVRKARTAAGFRFAPDQAAKIQLSKLDFDARLGDRKLDPASASIRRVVEEAVQSRGWVVDDDSLVVERQVKMRAQQMRARMEDVEKPNVTLKSRSTVKTPSVSFDFTGQGKMGFRPLPPEARERRLVEGDEGEGEGVIRGFRSNAPELRELNGSDIKVKIKFHIDQVDMSGVARGRVDFELQSVK